MVERDRNSKRYKRLVDARQDRSKRKRERGEAASEGKKRKGKERSQWNEHTSDKGFMEHEGSGQEQRGNVGRVEKGGGERVLQSVESN